MSTSNSAAIRRRSSIVQPSPIQQTQQNNQSNNAANAQSNTTTTTNAGMTLPQVIAVIDKRLIILETFMKDEVNEKIAKKNEPNLLPIPEPDDSKVSREDFNSVIDEYSHRFNILANEIAELKDIILKLQSYTMDVNKVLMDERIHNTSVINDNVSTNNPISIESSYVPIVQQLESNFVPTVQDNIEPDFPKTMEISNLIPTIPLNNEVESSPDNTIQKPVYKYNKKSNK